MYISLRKRAFTLIEMLVVVTIISVLASMVLVSFTKFKAKAREVQCVSNLKNLHGALMVQGDQMVGLGRYNSTGQWENPPNDDEELWYWRKGWINRHNINSPRGGWARWYQVGLPSDYRGSRGIFAITNGHLYEATGRISMKIFLCPTFNTVVRDNYSITDAVRSYNMNNVPQWKTYRSIAGDGKGFSRYLLFSEMGLTNSFAGAGRICRTAIFGPQASARGYDGVLELVHWSAGRPGEMYGRYHPGNTANAVFMDGHVEKLTYDRGLNAGKGNW